MRTASLRSITPWWARVRQAVVVAMASVVVLSACCCCGRSSRRNICCCAELVLLLCQELEKKYLRLTSAPDPRTVRPEPVLRKTLEHIRNRIAAFELDGSETQVMTSSM